MVLEVAILHIRAGQCAEFERSFGEAQSIISSMKGYASHQLQRCMEDGNKYLLLVHWNRLEDHTIGFRKSPEYQRWRELLHHFYDPFPAVEHFELVFAGGD
jgi:heme-degrading monooxygenase HmoA